MLYKYYSRYNNVSEIGRCLLVITPNAHVHNLMAERNLIALHILCTANCSIFRFFNGLYDSHQILVQLTNIRSMVLGELLQVLLGKIFVRSK